MALDSVKSSPQLRVKKSFCFPENGYLIINVVFFNAYMRERFELYSKINFMIYTQQLEY